MLKLHDKFIFMRLLKEWQIYWKYDWGNHVTVHCLESIDKFII